MDARSVWLSSQIHMYQGNQGRKLQIMANDQSAQRIQVLSRDHQDNKREFEPNQKKCTVDQAQYKSFGENRHNNTARQEGAWRLY